MKMLTDTLIIPNKRLGTKYLVEHVKMPDVNSTNSTISILSKSYFVSKKMLEWMAENSTDCYRFHNIDNGRKGRELESDVQQTIYEGGTLTASHHDIIMFKLMFGF